MRPIDVSARTLRACRCRSRTVSRACRRARPASRRPARLDVDGGRDVLRYRVSQFRSHIPVRAWSSRSPEPLSPQHAAELLRRRGLPSSAIARIAGRRPWPARAASGDRRQHVRQLPVERLPASHGGQPEHREAARRARRACTARRRREGADHGDEDTGDEAAEPCEVRRSGRHADFSPERSTARASRSEPGSSSSERSVQAEQRLEAACAVDGRLVRRSPPLTCLSTSRPDLGLRRRRFAGDTCRRAAARRRAGRRPGPSSRCEQPSHSLRGAVLAPGACRGIGSTPVPPRGR